MSGATGPADRAIRVPAGPSLGAGRALAGQRGGNLPSEVRRAAPPGGRGQSRAGLTVRRVARRALRTPGRASSRARAVRRAAAWCAAGRFLFAWWWMGAGWGGDDGSQEIETWWHWPHYLLTPAVSLSPAAAAAAAFYFDSTLRGRERHRGAGGCPGLCAPSPWSCNQAAGRGPAGTQGAHTPNQAHICAPLLSGMLSQKAGDVSLPRLLGDSEEPWAHTHVHRCLLLLL